LVEHQDWVDGSWARLAGQADRGPDRVAT
jgi:hypothetical protein